MTAAELDRTLRKEGLLLSVLDANNLKLVGPKRQVTPQLIAAIKAKKKELLKHLKKKQNKHHSAGTLVSGDNAITTECLPSRMSVYRVIINGTPTTLITPSKQSPSEIMERLEKQFSQYEVTGLEPSPFSIQKGQAS